MPWILRKLRDNSVYVRTDDAGTPVSGPDGRVDIRYKLSASAKIYRAAVRNLKETGRAKDERPVPLPDGDDDAGERAQSKSGQSSGKSSGKSSGSRRSSKSKGGRAAAPATPIPDDAIVIYTDGACTGNPGPAGIGVVIMDGEKRRELSEYLGRGTNNIAELTAIARALEEVLDAAERPVFVHSDSSYSLGLLTKGWKAKANAELVAGLRELAARFAELTFVKVKGHAGIPENERADELARLAIELR